VLWQHVFQVVVCVLSAEQLATAHCSAHITRAWKLSSTLHDIYQCRMYSEKRLMMSRGTVRNMLNT